MTQGFTLGWYVVPLQGTCGFLMSHDPGFHPGLVCGAPSGHDLQSCCRLTQGYTLGWYVVPLQGTCGFLMSYDPGLHPGLVCGAPSGHLWLFDVV